MGFRGRSFLSARIATLAVAVAGQARAQRRVPLQAADV
jgi:hypothetical protein